MGGKNYTEDDCWEPRYGNDSRPWLFGHNQEHVSRPKVISCHHQPVGVEGIRKQLLRKALWEETRQEMNEELLREEAEPATTTHYKDVFVKQGFQPSPIKIDHELHRQYPLYGDRDFSVWSEKLPNLPGATRVPHIQHTFRRCAGFTTPVDQALDECLDLK